MASQTPRLGLDNFTPGEDDEWDHSDLVQWVDEHGVQRGPLADRPASGEYDGEPWLDTDNDVLTYWDETAAAWQTVADVTASEVDSTVEDHRANDVHDQPQPPQDHGLAEHDAATLAEVNGTVSDATLDDAGDARPPQAHDHSGDALAPDSLAGADIANAASGTVPQAQGDGTLAMADVGGGGGGVAVNAADYDGANGGEQIQAAIDDADSQPGANVVVVPADGPDDVSGSGAGFGNIAASQYQNAWRLTSTIEIPSHTTLVFYGLLFLDSATDTWMIGNADQSGGNRDIHIDGRGVGTIHGNVANHGSITDELGYGVYLANVDNFSARGYHIKNTATWANCFQGCSNGSVQRIYVDQDNSKNQQDGIHLIGPAEDISHSHVYGVSGDDFVALHNSSTQQSTSVATEGDMTDLSFSHFHIDTNGFNGWKIDPEDHSYVIDTVTIDESSVENGNAPIDIGGEAGAPVDNVRNVSISNTHLDGNYAGVKFTTGAKNVKLANVHVDAEEKFIDPQGDVEGVTIQGGSVTPGDTNGNGVIHFDGYSYSDITVSGFRADFDPGDNSNWDHYLVMVTSSATLERAQIEAQGDGVESNLIVETDATVDRVRCSFDTDVSFSTALPYDDGTGSGELGETVGITVDGVGEAALAGSAPDATNWWRGAKVRDTDNPGDVYLVYGEASGDVTQIGSSA